jgi:hypothetical protein
VTVAVYPSDHTGCGCYRMIWPAHAAAAAGHSVDLWMMDDEQRMTALTRYSALDGRHHVAELVNEPDAEVCVFQRPSSRLVVEAMRLLADRGHRVVAELDDDLARLHPANSAHRALDPVASPDSNYQWLAQGLAVAHWRVFSTPALLERYGQPGDWVVPNAVPDAYLDIKGQESFDTERIGWAGSVATHPGDLGVVGSGVEKALRWTDGRFWMVGPPTGVAAELGIAGRRVMSTGQVRTLAYASTVASAFSIGIAPLARSPFNNAKSWLKPLEFTALWSNRPISASRRPSRAGSPSNGPVWSSPSPRRRSTGRGPVPNE